MYGEEKKKTLYNNNRGSTSEVKTGSPSSVCKFTIDRNEIDLKHHENRLKKKNLREINFIFIRLIKSIKNDDHEPFYFGFSFFFFFDSLRKKLFEIVF